jgi:hypothetical protein
MLTRDPEAGPEIFVASLRFTILESYPNNFVAGRLRTIPRALERYECIATIFCWELFPFVEHKVQNRGVRLEEYVWNDGCFNFFRLSMCKAWLRVGADVGIRPAVERALLHTSQIIRRKIIPKSITLLNPCVEFSSSWWNASVVGLRMPEANVFCLEPSGSNR